MVLFHLGEAVIPHVWQDAGAHDLACVGVSALLTLQPLIRAAVRQRERTASANSLPLCFTKCAVKDPVCPEGQLEQMKTQHVLDIKETTTNIIIVLIHQ